MKLNLCIVYFLFYTSLPAQDFNEQIYYENSGTWYPHTGMLENLNDTLAAIQFLGPGHADNSYFACTFYFKDDTLFLKELSEPVDLNKAVICKAPWMAAPDLITDSIHLGYQVYYESGGSLNYDSLYFEVNGVKYLNTKQCDSHCALVPRPITNEFDVRIWNGVKQIDTYHVLLEDQHYSVRMTKNIFSSSCCPFSFNESDSLFNGFEIVLSKIPNSVMIDQREYVLNLTLHDRSYRVINLFTKD